MFRGFRWQFVVLLLALAVFLAGVAFRFNRGQGPLPPAPSPVATQPAIAATVAPDPPRAQATAPESASTRADATYREGMIGAVRRLNPLFAQLNPVDRDISSLIFEGLFATNDYGEVIPRLAEALVISADGLNYVVALREDARWQNGMPFSADDVVYTMSLLSDPEYAEIAPVGEFWATVETQKLGDHLLRFRLAQPLSSFPHLLTIGILPAHALRGTTISQLARHPFNLSPIGTGPYQLANLRLGADGEVKTVELARSPVFMRRPESQGRFQLARLSFHLFQDAEAALDAYQAGGVNALAKVAPRERLLTLPGSRVLTATESSLATLIFNWKEPPFAERRLRQALSLSLDLPKLIETLARADVTYADSPYTPGASIYRSHAFWTRHDIAQARTLLEAADMLVDSEDEATAETAAMTRFTLLIEDEPPGPQLARQIATQWNELGIALDIEAVERDEFANRLETGRFQLAIVSLRIGGDFDLYRYWHPAQYGKGQNYGAAANHETAELIEKARREIYSSRRLSLLQQFQAAFAEQAIAIPLYYPLFTFIVDEAIEGIQLGYLASPADRFRGIANWRPAMQSG